MALRVTFTLWTKIHEQRLFADPGPGGARPLEFDLGTAQPVDIAADSSSTADAQVSPNCEAFPLCPDRGRKDLKGSRIVEKECASRSFFW
jgi:hypothetical protein